MNSSRGIAAERGQSRSFSDRPSSLQSLRQDFSQALGRAWGGVISGEESEGILLRVWEAAGSQEPPCFLFFFSETGCQHCSEEDWSFSLLGTLCPGRHSRDHLEPLQIRRVV